MADKVPIWRAAERLWIIATDCRVGGEGVRAAPRIDPERKRLTIHFSAGGAEVRFIWQAGDGQGRGHLEADSLGRQLETQPRTLGWTDRSSHAWWLGANLLGFLKQVKEGKPRHGRLVVEPEPQQVSRSVSRFGPLSERETPGFYWELDNGIEHVRFCVRFRGELARWSVEAQWLSGCLVHTGEFGPAWQKWRSR